MATLSVPHITISWYQTTSSIPLSMKLLIITAIRIIAMATTPTHFTEGNPKFAYMQVNTVGNQ